MSYLNLDRKTARCMKPWCRQVVDNNRKAKQGHDAWHAATDQQRGKGKP